MVSQPSKLAHVDSVSHDGLVVVFGEDRPDDGPAKLWYKVLDLQQTADRDDPGSWEDSTRWTRWYEVPFPEELRAAGMSLLTVRRTVDHSYARDGGRWKVLSNNGHIYLFRALDLASSPGADTVRVYANRYSLPRELSPDGSTSKGTTGTAITVPQLRCAREARYRRSGQRETPQSNIDSQGTRDMTNAAFEAPTLEFSMLRPLAGQFTVTLTPSAVPGRERWQFFCKAEFQPEPEPDADPDAELPAPRPAIACYSLLRDEDGWVDLADKFDLLNTRDDPFAILPDRTTVLVHAEYGDLELSSRPDALTFRLQEQSGGLDDEEERAVSPERVMLAALVSWPGTGENQGTTMTGLVAVDFPLTDTGAIEIGSQLAVQDVRFARTALRLDAPSDAVTLSSVALDDLVRNSDFSVHAWIRHDAGSGMLVGQSLAAGQHPTGLNGWWAIEWDASTRELVATYCATQNRKAEIRVPAPVSFTWHHVALTRSVGTLKLYVDGVLVGRNDDAESASDAAVRGPVTLGGPLAGDDSWLDYRIDQLTVYRKVVEPSLDTIYFELSEEQRQHPDIVGHWTFDVGDGGEEDALLDSGADRVTQTAPLFPPEPPAFEQTLGGQSTGMGLVTAPGWTMEPGIGPNLFRGADGIVRVYLAARYEDADEASAATLVYDTTSTRAQFTFPWKATTDKNERTGMVVMSGRKVGPILNRAQLQLDEGPGGLKLTISHPHVPHYREEWFDLPRELADFVKVINGGASDDANADDVRNGSVPYYNYAAKGPYGDRSGPYASELFQAAAASAPDNGGEALVIAGAAASRQQGNFTGWTRAPLAVSGRFGTHTIHDDNGVMTAGLLATAASTLDGVVPLRAPGDFALELWANPAGELGRQTLVCWHQDQGDGVSLAIEPVENFAFSDADVGGHVLLATTADVRLQNGGLAMQSRFQIPHGGSGGASGDLIVEESSVSWTLDADGIIDEVLALRIAEADTEEDKTAAQTWADSVRPADDAPATTIAGSVTVIMKVQGRRVLLTTRQTLEQPSAGSIADLWLALLTGKPAAPDGETWSVSRDAAASEPLDTEVVLLDAKLSEPEGTYVTVDMRLTTRADVQAQVELTTDMLRTISTAECLVGGVQLATSDSSVWVRAGDVPASARILLGTAQVGEIPFTGAIESVKLWDRPLNGTLLVEAVPTRDGDDAIVQISGSLGDRSVVVDGVESGFRVATCLGDRAYRTPLPISASDWLHLALVCSDNIAIRCTQDGDRAVISDADSLNPHQGLTIDCIFVRTDDRQERWLFAKTVLAGDSPAITFALGITADGRPHLRYTLEVESDYQVYDLYGKQQLSTGRPYQLFASVKLAEYFNPEQQSFGKPADDAKPRYQVWMQHAILAVWDIASASWVGGKPRDFPSSYADASQRWVATTLFGTDAWKHFLIPFPATPDNEWTMLLRQQQEDDSTQSVTFRSTEGPAAIGALSGEDPATLEGQDLGYWRGVVGHVRVWTSTLSVAALERLATQPGHPSGVDKPSAWWQLDENRGLQANDSQGGGAARLSREQLWTFARETARLSLFIGGRTATLEPSSYRPSYGEPGEFRLGGRSLEVELFEGQLDDIRLWSDIRSNEEILDNMHRRLAGNEDDLLAYWPISARSGPLLKDLGAGAHHARLNIENLAFLRSFWSSPGGAPVGDDLPQIRHMLGGPATSYTASRVASPSTASEYSEIQIDTDGQLVGVYKRALAWVDTEGNDGQATGFKTGDADLTYIGQAQSDPTLIGYIEGAPPVPSENLTRAYWSSATQYGNYSGNTAVTLEAAENTTLTFASGSNRGDDYSFSGKTGVAIKGSVELDAGFSWGGHTAAGVPLAEFELKPASFQGNREEAWSSNKPYEVGIGTARTISNTLALGGSWETADGVLNPTVGRRYVPDNIGYALVKSGVANVYVMQLRSNGAMLGIQMIPDPDIPEDFNILTFKIRDDYTRQGSLDGKVGYVNDPAYPNADQERGSYFRPLEVANLEAQIEAYEARLLANYDTFNANKLGREELDDGDEHSVIDDNLEIPYDWDENLSKRNIVNTYVWTSTGGFFAEQLKTSVTRTESLGGSYSCKRMLGFQTEGTVIAGGFGMFWDIGALWGTHVETTVTKTKAEGRDFGLDVKVTCDDMLEVYTGDPLQMYSGSAAPGKVNGYRFKSFYLVPDKQHFATFWDTVVDADWLDGDDNDARALRQAKANLNNVWRVFHRVTYVSRVPPKDQASLGNKGAATRSIVHEIPNWQVINLVLDVIRTGVDSRGNKIGISHPGSAADVSREHIALAVDDVVTHQWGPNAPWWDETVTAAHPYEDDPNTDEDDGTLGELDPSTAAGKSFQQLRKDVYDYMVAYFETGLADQNPRLYAGPAGPDPVEPEQPEEPPLPPLDTLEDGAEEAIHLYTLSRTWRQQDARGLDELNFNHPVELRFDELPSAVQGRLSLPGSSLGPNGKTVPPQRAHLAMSADWGRVGDRSYELVFRLTKAGPVVLLAPSAYLDARQKPFHWLCIDNERRDGALAIFPVGAEHSVSLPGLDTQSLGKLVYLALSFTHSRPVDEDAGTPAADAELIIHWSVEGQNRIRSQKLTAIDGDTAGGHMVIAGDGEDLFHYYFAQGGFDLFHLAVHAVALDEREVDRRARALGLIT